MFNHKNHSNGSAEEKNNKGRYRKMNMNMHVSVEEKEMIDARVALSGLSKRDFCVQSLMNQKVICYGNIRVTEEMKRQLNFIEQRLLEMQSGAEMEESLLEKVRMILEMLESQRLQKSNQKY